jgi:hypothetical protein
MQTKCVGNSQHATLAHGVRSGIWDKQKNRDTGMGTATGTDTSKKVQIALHLLVRVGFSPQGVQRALEPSLLIDCTI